MSALIPLRTYVLRTESKEQGLELSELLLGDSQKLSYAVLSDNTSRKSITREQQTTYGSSVAPVSF